jgi:tetratricopeptide (TPR) repeat protein
LRRENTRSGVETGQSREAQAQELALRLEFLRHREAEDPGARWFLPLGAALRDLGHPEEAAEVLRQGLARDPDCLGGWVVLGQCYLAMGEVVVARGLFESIAARDAENALVLEGLAGTHALEGDRERAADCYRALLRLKPRDLGAQNALASLLEPAQVELASEAETAELEAALPHRSSNPRTRPGVEGGKRAAVMPPRGSRLVLAPEARTPGIFEPPPADLDGEEEPRSRRQPRERDRTGSESEAPERSRASREGYRRWLERMAGRELDGKGSRGSSERMTSAEPELDPDWRHPPSHPTGGGP